MAATTGGSAATVEYWDRNVRWYDLWVHHNGYHDEVIGILTELARPGLRVLDIGGAGGVLALPLAEQGCTVTVIEPSKGMRGLLSRAIQGVPAGNLVAVDQRRWEETDPKEFSAYDLVLACNSLHLTAVGLEKALRKVFLAGQRMVLVVNEAEIPEADKVSGDAYRLSFFKVTETESSFVYHSLDEAHEHLAFRKGRPPTPDEKARLQSRLVLRDGHLRLIDSATVYIYLWMRKEN